MLARLNKGIAEVMGKPTVLKDLSPADLPTRHSAYRRSGTFLRNWKSPAATPAGIQNGDLPRRRGVVGRLAAGMVLEGVVTNVAAFGAFVDIGVHQDGLVHVSALANKFVKDPHEVVKPGQIVKVKVLSVDVARQRISLTMRMDDAATAAGQPDLRAGNGTRGRDRRPGDASRAASREPQPTSAFALAMARAQQKK